jgi:hypothetical protein
MSTLKKRETLEIDAEATNILREEPSKDQRPNKRQDHENRLKIRSHR